MPHFIRLSLLVAVLVFTSACARGTKLSPADRAATHSVVVRKTSYFPKKDGVFYYTFGQNLTGSMGGALGAGIAHAATANEREKFSALFAQHKIDVGQIMGERFEQKLKASGMFPSKGKPDAEFRVTVTGLGVAIPHGFAIRMYPSLAVDAELVNQSGKRIWQRTDFVSGAHSSVQPGVLEDWQENPELLRKNFEACADRLAAALIADLNSR